MADHATDERLLEEAANGNTAAFQILYERYRDPIFRFAYRLLGSVEAAEDDEEGVAPLEEAEEEDEELIEDASELGEDEDDMAEVIDNVEEEEP